MSASRDTAGSTSPRAAEEAAAGVKVLYIAGAGRSGSTILDSILGQLDGFVAVGELRYLWERGLVAGRLCGCGVPVPACPMWTAVLAEAAAAVGEVGAERMLRLQQQHTRARNVPGMLSRRGGPAVSLQEYQAALGELYRAIARHTGCRVIVDSSKLPSYGRVVDGVPGVDLRVVHLVRDPRATAWSWLRKKQLVDFGDSRLMQRQRPLKSSGLWTMWNLVAGLFWGRRQGSYLRVRYEDFVRDPQRTVRAIAELAGESPAELPFSSPTSVRLIPTHSVAGNPSRLHTGEVALRADDEWVTKMGGRDRALVTAVTWPLLLRYGYPIDPR